MNFNYDHLRALSAILRHGSFDGAAAALHVTQSAISQRLKALEEQVGARLVVRGTPCMATDLGAKLARHMEDVALMEAQVLPAEDAAPTVSLAVNADSLATWIIPALAAVPQLRFNLIVDDQDHSADLLASGAVAAAITARRQPVQGCDAIALGALDYVATANPGFASKWFDRGVTAEALEAAPALIYSRNDALQSGWAEQETGRAVTLQGHILPSTTAFVDAAERGLGWGMNPRALVQDALRKRRLVAIGRRPGYQTPLYWQIARRLKPTLAPLTRAIRQSAQEHLKQR